MIDAFALYAPWILSGLTIWTAFLAGNKNRNAWAVGFASQGLWLAWIVASGTWGMIPGNIALWVVYARNHFKWNAK